MKFISLFFAILFLTSLISANCSKNQININSASLKELDKIVWVGPATAQKIINNRPYRTIDELEKVKGIGDVKLKKIKTQNLACVGELGQKKVTKDISGDSILEKSSVKIVKHSKIPLTNVVDMSVAHNGIKLNKSGKFQKTIVLNNYTEAVRPVYVSNGARVMDKLSYVFSVFLIFLIIVLIWERF